MRRARQRETNTVPQSSLKSPANHATGGMDDFDREQHGDAPQNGKFEADIPFQVKAAGGIIPPLVVEEAFEHPARDKLDERRQPHAHEKDEPCAGDVLPQNEEHGDHPRAIDGADGAVEKAAVDELALRDGVKGDFRHPA